MFKKGSLGKQFLILSLLFALTLAVALFAAVRLKTKTASTAEDVENYEISRATLLRLKAKIEEYRDAHDNSLPESLNELLPEYLRELPGDAFGHDFVYDRWKDGGVALLSFLGRDGQEGGLGINKDFTLRLKVLKE